MLNYFFPSEGRVAKTKWNPLEWIEHHGSMAVLKGREFQSHTRVSEESGTLKTCDLVRGK